MKLTERIDGSKALDWERIEMDKRPLTADYIKAVITADNQIIPVVAKQDMTAAASSSTSKEVIHKS